MTTPPVCNYEGSDYQSSFWEQGGREYEDRVEAIALKRLLPKGGRLMLEVGAGAGRNTPRYVGFERIVLLDYSQTQLEQAQGRLGKTEKYVYVAADAYRLPFVDGLFDAATMIRTLHHMAAAPRALQQVRNVLAPDATFILEFANKLNIKAILRYWFRRQAWSPFTREPVEFAKLNFDFHPKTIYNWLHELDFHVEKTLTVSHFRTHFLKRLVPLALLVFFDSMLQWTGAWFQLTPSVFVRAVVRDPAAVGSEAGAFFKCPECGHAPLEERAEFLTCHHCKRKWGIQGGIYDFREPIES
ncbi:MAG TPA: class I SAM-dependent methyltransferase [Anaerolineales bacterium]|nr:class I SAM-dependent methyltransferase [Anaerolineales bacterium]